MTARRITCDGPACPTWVEDTMPADWFTVLYLGRVYHFEDGECLLRWVASWTEPVVDLGELW